MVLIGVADFNLPHRFEADNALRDEKIVELIARAKEDNFVLFVLLLADKESDFIIGLVKHFEGNVNFRDHPD